MVRSLEQLKEQIVSGHFSSLPQLQKWQLAAACQNLSEELAALASLLNTRSLESTPRGSTIRIAAIDERPGASVSAVPHRPNDTSF
jgi:hypothetical protein